MGDRLLGDQPDKKELLENPQTFKQWKHFLTFLEWQYSTTVTIHTVTVTTVVVAEAIVVVVTVLLVVAAVSYTHLTLPTKRIV